MKRFLWRLLALCALVAAFAAPAEAARWKTQEVGWYQSYVVGTTITIRDTAFRHVGAVGLADTTEWFMLTRLSNPAPNSSVADSGTVVGYWIFVSDTSATYTATLTALTVATDVGYATTTATAAVAPTVTQQNVATGVSTQGSMLVTTGRKIVAVPIVLPVGAAQSVNLAGGAIAGMAVRGRVTAGVGSQGLAQCRAFISWYTDEP